LSTITVWVQRAMTERTHSSEESSGSYVTTTAQIIEGSRTEVAGDMGFCIVRRRNRGGRARNQSAAGSTPGQRFSGLHFQLH
jgi:hypothetical protein